MQNKKLQGRGFVILSCLLACVGISSGMLVSATHNKASTHAFGMFQSMKPKPASFAVTKSTQTIDLLFMGDVMLARSIGQQIDNGKDPFEFTRVTINEHDIAIANIETTIADPSVARQTGKPYTFNAPLSSLQTLKNAGIDVSSLANNHTGDYGRAATQNTIDQFALEGLKTVGAGASIKEAFRPVIITEQDISVAFIAVNDIELSYTKVSEGNAGSAYLDKELIVKAIEQSRVDGADAIVVMPHWGIEYSPTVSAIQTEWGRFMIDAGADLVIGSHPHVVQPTEQYNGGQIVYSLGNFVFDGMPNTARVGQMASVSLTVNKKSIDDESVLEKEVKVSTVGSLPIQINIQGFPELL